MNRAHLRGLRFPDEYIIRFFFKMGLHEKRGKVLEVGCGNGNNLLLFYEFGWDTVGVDINAQALQDGDFNFRMAQRNDCTYRFIQHDLSTGLKRSLSGKYDVGLIPNVLCYLSRGDALKMLREMAIFLQPSAPLFLRTRSVRDYRYGRGEKIGHNSFRLATPETNEAGLINVFYHEYELVDILRNELRVDASTMTIGWVDFQNAEHGVLVHNSDIVIWGRIHA